MLTNNQNTFSPLSTHRTFGTVNGGQMNRPQGMKSRSVPYHQHLLKFANVDFLHVTECSSGPTFAQEQYFSQVSNNKILHLGSGDTYGQLVVYRKDWHVTALSNGSNILNPMAWTGIDPLVKATLTYCHGRHIFLKIVTDMGNTLYYLGIHNSRETEGNIAENEKIGWVVQLLTNLGVDFIVGGDFNKGLYEGSKSRPRQTSVNRIQQGVFQFHNNPLEATTTALNKVYAIDYMGTGFSTNYFKYQSYDLLKEDFYVFPKGNHYPIIIYVQETLNKQINYQGLIQGPHYQQVAYVNYNRQQIDQGYNHNYMVYQRNIQPSYTQSLDDDFLRTFYYNNWNSTQAQFCRDFKIDAGNFSNWLRRKLQSSPASKTAVQSYYQMMNFSM